MWGIQKNEICTSYLMMNIEQQRLLALIRCSLFDRQEDVSLFSSMSFDDWDVLRRTAKKQGVSAITFHAFEKISVRPEIDNLMDWMYNTTHLEQTISVRISVAKSLVKLWDIDKDSNSISYDMDMLILKGLSLAYLYPMPKSRGFGDLDVYTFNGHNIANQKIKEKGIAIDHEDKHDIYKYKGVVVEHHSTFVGTDNHTGRLINDYLQNVISNDGCKRSIHGWLEPTPNFNVVFLLRHMTRHLATEGCPLRNVIDYALFILKEGDKINWDITKQVLNSTKMVKAFDTILSVCETLFCVDFSRYYISTPDPVLSDKVIDEVLNLNLHAESKYSTVVRFVKKTQRLFSRKWIYDTQLLPDYFWREVVWESIREHIRKPSYI